MKKTIGIIVTFATICVTICGIVAFKSTTANDNNTSIQAFYSATTDSDEATEMENEEQATMQNINPNGTTIETRITPPKGFVREKCDAASFTYYLRNLPLKKHGSKVLLYDKTEKAYQAGNCAVINMEIGETDLQQCADAVIRLRAEYLWKQKKYADIHFKFTNGFVANYTQWAEGGRINVRGNNTTWQQTATKDYSYKTFREYLDKVFMYAGTASLSRELIPVQISRIQPGDVFMHGGHPGHAMIVVDVVKNPQTKKIAFICAQSYMPAQEIEIVKNLNDDANSPWYIVNPSETTISFPQWTFTANELKRFQ